MRHWKNPVLFLACVLGTVPSSACAETASQSNPKYLQYSASTLLSAAQVEKDILIAKEAYERIHPGYTRYTNEAKLTAAWEAVVKKVRQRNGITVGEFYLEVQKVLTLIRCDHTKAELPSALAKDRNITPVYLPLRWTLIEDRAIVTLPGSTGLERGDEILSIDGRPISEMILEVAPFIPVDGYADWAKRSGISESFEFRGGAIDHFGALLWDIKPKATLKVADKSGGSREVVTDRVTFKEWTALNDDAPDKIASNFKDGVKFSRIGDKAGYLRVDTFVNYRDPIKPAKLYDPVFNAMREEGRDTLILDLRNNGGGSFDAQSALTAYLFNKPVKANSDARVKTLNHKGLEQYLWTWDSRAINPNRLGFRKNNDGSYSMRPFVEEALKPIKPNKRAFTGRVIALTSDSNSSASTSQLTLLKATGRATLVGARTGGSPDGPSGGLQFTVTLPESGIKTRLPMIRYFNDLKLDGGFGLSPDIEAKMTVNDYRLGRDPAFEAAKKMAFE